MKIYKDFINRLRLGLGSLTLLFKTANPVTLNTVQLSPLSAPHPHFSTLKANLRQLLSRVIKTVDSNLFNI